MKRLRACLALSGLLLVMAGCDSERLTQFAEFSTAGTQYVQAFHKLIIQAGSAFIAADSVTLTVARSQAGPAAVAANAAQFRTDVHTDDKLLAKILVDLGTIDQQATNLCAYFDSISKLTDGKLTSSMTTATTGLLKSVKDLEPAVGKVTLGGEPLSTVVKGATEIVVAHFEVKALNDQLKIAAPVVDTALSLQEAAVERIGDRMKADLAVSLEAYETTHILDPYVKPVPDLPSDWNARRETFLRATATIASVDCARSAIGMLHKAFIQLVQNKQTISLATLLNQIDKISGYAGTIESSLEKKK